MTTKQMLLSTLILGTTTVSIIAGERTPEQQKQLNEEFLNAAAETDSEKVFQLLNIGADINAQDILGETGLHKAISGKDNWLAAILMEKGINTKVQNKNGETAAHYAAEKCNCRILEFMYNNYRIDPTIKDNKGKILLDKAQEKLLYLHESHPYSHILYQNKISRCQKTIAFLKTIKKR